MNIVDAQRENRFRFSGGFYGQAVSGLLWLVSASLASWGSPRTAIKAVLAGGFFIFPITELLVRTIGSRLKLDRRNSMPELGMQVALVLPFSMPLLLPVSLYQLNWFYPALMILLGAHYLPFVFLYGMKAHAAPSVESGDRSGRERASDIGSAGGRSVADDLRVVDPDLAAGEKVNPSTDSGAGGSVGSARAHRCLAGCAARRAAGSGNGWPAAAAGTAQACGCRV